MNEENLYYVKCNYTLIILKPQNNFAQFLLYAVNLIY